MNQLIKVLVIEDDNVDYRRVQRPLTRGNQSDTTFEVNLCTSLQSAGEYLTEQRADVILLDLNLPDSRGLRTVREVIEIAVGTPVIALTGVEDERIAREAVRAGAVDYLSKSDVTPQAVIQLIKGTANWPAVALQENL